MKIKIFQIIFLKAKIGLPFTCYDDFQRAAEGGGHMSAGERRQRILELLCLRRQDTYGNLARDCLDNSQISSRRFCKSSMSAA